MREPRFTEVSPVSVGFRVYQVHSPASAHPARERVRALELRGQKISVAGEDGKKGRELPSLYLHCAMQVNCSTRSDAFLLVFCYFRRLLWNGQTVTGCLRQGLAGLHFFFPFV